MFVSAFSKSLNKECSFFILLLMIVMTELFKRKHANWRRLMEIYLKSRTTYSVYCQCNEIGNDALFVFLLNSLAPGRSECDSKNGIFNLVLLIGIFRSSHENALRWMPQDFTDDKSTLVQVMAWCRQATSHYLSQCWLSPLSPYGVISPQCETLKTKITTNFPTMFIVIPRMYW